MNFFKTLEARLSEIPEYASLPISDRIKIKSLAIRRSLHSTPSIAFLGIMIITPVALTSGDQDAMNLSLIFYCILGLTAAGTILFAIVNVRWTVNEVRKLSREKLGELEPDKAT